MNKIRLDHESPECIASWGWKFHHIGIPTKERKENERSLPLYKTYVSGFETSPFGIEWMRFEEDSEVQELIQKIPHIAFEVEDIDWEIKNRGLNVISPPAASADGIRDAMVEYNGALIQLFEFDMNK